MRPALLMAALAATMVTACAAVPKATRFGDHKGILEVNAGEVNEICPQLFAGQRIIFDFEASQTLLFNFHYHRGEAVTYPVTEQSMARYEGTFTAPEDNLYCLMWTGRTEASRIRYNYRITD